jgi:hypothetical protein
MKYSIKYDLRGTVLQLKYWRCALLQAHGGGHPTGVRDSLRCSSEAWPPFIPSHFPCVANHSWLYFAVMGLLFCRPRESVRGLLVFAKLIPATSSSALVRRSRNFVTWIRNEAVLETTRTTNHDSGSCFPQSLPLPLLLDG